MNRELTWFWLVMTLAGGIGFVQSLGLLQTLMPGVVPWGLVAVASWTAFLFRTKKKDT